MRTLQWTGPWDSEPDILGGVADSQRIFLKDNADIYYLWAAERKE